MESLLLYSHNKTSAWLQSKTPEERQRLLQAARTMTSLHRKKFLKRREEICAKRLEIIKERERDIIKKILKELKDKESITLKIQQIGLWTTLEEISGKLQELQS